MRRAFLIVILALPTSACKSFWPLEEPSQEIQRRIVSEGLLTSGDEVRVVTRDGTVHEFRIVEVDIDQGRLTGRDDAVRIEEVVALERRRLSWIKTGILIGGIALSTFSSSCEDDCGDGPFRDAALFCC